MNPISMLINGERTQASNGATFERRNPLDGSVATTAPAATARDAVAAVEAASAAFATWSQTGPGELRAVMKAAQALEAKGDAFAEAMALETGASALWACVNQPAWCWPMRTSTPRSTRPPSAPTSTERIVVDASIADEFVAKLAARAQSLPLGDPRTGPVVLGSVVDMSTVERCNRLIDDALAKGATLVAGGQATSTLMPATLLDHVTAEMKIFREEAFGPVKGVVRVNGVEEAVDCANESEYGLAAAVFGRDLARAMQVARRIESGICHVNGPTVHDEAQMPFGGVKGSGIGRFGGKAGVDAFTELRWFTVQTTPRHYPF